MQTSVYPGLFILIEYLQKYSAIMGIILGWVDIDLRTGRVQDFLDFGKCSRQRNQFWRCIKVLILWLRPCFKALIHGRDRYLLHIQDTVGKNITSWKPTTQKWKYHGQPGNGLLTGLCCRIMGVPKGL